MERNPNDNFDSQTPGSTGGSSGSSGMSGAGGYGAGAGSTSGSPGASGAGYGTTGAGSAGMSGGAAGAGTEEQKLSERAREKLGTAKEKAQSGLTQAREKAGVLKNSLADKLDAGADKLRQRQGSGAYAGAAAGTTGAGGVGVSSSEGNMDRVSGGLASGMHSTAEWLRENDLDSMKQGIEQQVRDHPGRTLAIAVGLGYLIGKAFRR